MKDFKTNNRFGGGNKGGDDRSGDRIGFRGGNNFGKRDFGGSRQMYEAVCAKCNKKCEVPFRPNGERPVYCRDCFGDNRTEQGQSNNFPRKDFQKREFAVPPAFKSDNNAQISDIKRQLDAISAKLDRLIQKIDGSQKEVKDVVLAKAKESLGEVVSKVQETSKKVVTTKKERRKKR